MNYFVSMILGFSIFSSFIQAEQNVASSMVKNNQPQVVIYTIQGCIGCGMAKSMFEDRNIPFKEIDVNRNKARYDEMVMRAGGKVGDEMGVPKIFIDDKFIGGYSDVSNELLDSLQARFSSNKIIPSS